MRIVLEVIFIPDILAALKDLMDKRECRSDGGALTTTGFPKRDAFRAEQTTTSLSEAPPHPVHMSIAILS